MIAALCARFVRLRVFFACFLSAVAAIPTNSAAVGEPLANNGLRFTPAGNEYAFDTGVVRGLLRKGGQTIGLKPIVDIATGDQIALRNNNGILSPYRLFTTNRRFGDAAWTWASEAALLPDGAVEVSWKADGEHPFTMKAVYRLAAANVVDFRVAIRPRTELKHFELFVASYCQAPDAFVYVQEDLETSRKAAFLPVKKSDGIWQCFPRDGEVLAMVRDGRWRANPHPVEWVIRPLLAAPLAFRHDASTGQTLVLMSSPRDCFMVASPYSGEPHRSLYFSLFGRDLPAGQEAQASLRMVVGRNLSHRQSLDLYNDYLKEQK